MPDYLDQARGQYADAAKDAMSERRVPRQSAAIGSSGPSERMTLQHTSQHLEALQTFLQDALSSIHQINARLHGASAVIQGGAGKIDNVKSNPDRPPPPMVPELTRRSSECVDLAVEINRQLLFMSEGL